MDNPDYWRTIKDPTTGEQVVLSNEEVDIIQRIQGRINGDGEEQHPEHVDFFTNTVMIHPVGNEPEPKRRFIPSVHEHKKIMKIVRGIRDGRIQVGARDRSKKKEEKPKVYEMWAEGDVPTKDHYMHMPAPKMKLPGHEESYNPPSEYLLNKEEQAEWEALDMEDREPKFLPTKYSALRLVPRYDDFIQERFERCLDLYLCPRGRKNRVNIDPESLIPKLPKPKELQPFPIACVVDFVGHTSNIVSIATSPSGQYLASVSLDKTLRLWETVSGRCVRTIALQTSSATSIKDAATCVAWNPNPEISIIAVSIGQDVCVYNPRLGAREAWEAVDVVLARAESAPNQTSGINWAKAGDDQRERHGLRMRVTHSADVTSVTWHKKGDYFAAVTPTAPEGVAIHQLSRSRSQTPFKKAKGTIQKVQFHPTRPIFFVATQRYVRVYNLSSQELIKKLITGVKWVSSMDVHPAGDNLIIGSYDRRLCWFDLDLSVRPYKTLRYHTQALRGVAFHQKYPLFASCSDDGKVHVFHGRVFNDLNQNALIVPVKVLEGHTRTSSGTGVMDIKFHPTQPWVFSCSAAGELKMWT
ncbi:ribosome biogenesis protein bop1 [Sphaeroforma arctica JP610]|uniref:Ribosome biogenesis protein BOP1 homolog n=1 Tax=Sphaeroforma arctica JP610 TaxID=667725 RepID=A0A0L0FQE1_9EUKA|nr:ribosome biogenesis protein bop1 [Sphaeroforma arctica JP610]KNC78997.1 ribosome biogenesis protein bop1 [Sphaeroforma arctica JP610]|eukprot:XP_014152899.1 ribosome biogenesis protein bop1 [Sphaeroforma arctica JP610]